MAHDRACTSGNPHVDNIKTTYEHVDAYSCMYTKCVTSEKFSPKFLRKPRLGLPTTNKERLHGLPIEVEKNAYPNVASRYEQNACYRHVLSVSKGSYFEKLKFLCSFGTTTTTYLIPPKRGLLTEYYVVIVEVWFNVIFREELFGKFGNSCDLSCKNANVSNIEAAVKEKDLSDEHVAMEVQSPLVDHTNAAKTGTIGWNPDVDLLKEDVENVPVWVKLHGVPVTTFSDDGLSAIATKLGTPLMLDSYTCDMCLQS
nr:hypothetical protein [Tanacetum cinerariifolium]